MSIEFVCPTCSGTLRVGDESAGRVIRCGACLTMLRVPGAAAEPETETAPGGDAPAAPPSPFEDAPAAAVPVSRPRARAGDRADDRDPDDRPRRRRRRRPPPPPGRSVLFWLALIGGIVMLLVGGCCGGLYFAVPGPKWHTHESAKGGFKVDLPAPARQDMDKIAGGPIDPNMTTEGTILFRSLEEYAIVHGDIPANERQWLTDQQRIDAAVDAMKTSGEVRSVIGSKEITVNGFPGREVEFSAEGGGYYGTRIVVADGRVYVLVGGGKLARQGNANVRRFLDSFEITDPKLRASGDQRVAAAKRADDGERQRKEQQAQVQLAWEKAEAERTRIEAERRKEEERLAEEKRKADEKVRLRNAAFLDHKYDGPEVPAPAAARDLHPISFEAAATQGRVSGPGVRGKAVYLPRGRAAAGVGPALGIKDADVLRTTARAWDGYTLSGWVRVRQEPVTVFRIDGSQAGSLLDVVLGPDVLTATVAGPKRSTLKHEWRGDEDWHHVAFVSDRNGTGPKVRLYLDGKLVASETNVAFIPGTTEAVWFGWVPDRENGAAGPGRFPRPAPGPGPTELLAAIDECAIIGRPLSDAEVAALAGQKPFPEAPAPRTVPERETAPAPRPVERD